LELEENHSDEQINQKLTAYHDKAQKEQKPEDYILVIYRAGVLGPRVETGRHDIRPAFQGRQHKQSRKGVTNIVEIPGPDFPMPAHELAGLFADSIVPSNTTTVTHFVFHKADTQNPKHDPDGKHHYSYIENRADRPQQGIDDDFHVLIMSDKPQRLQNSQRP
jgi:hypothetical protein